MQRRYAAYGSFAKEPSCPRYPGKDLLLASKVGRGFRVAPHPKNISLFRPEKVEESPPRQGWIASYSRNPYGLYPYIF